MLPVHFPDLGHPERTVDLDEYVTRLTQETDGDQRAAVHRLVVAVRDWALAVIDAADRTATTVPAHRGGAEPHLVRAVAAAGRRRRLPAAVQAAVSPGQERLAWFVLLGVTRATCRELPYRGMDRLRRAQSLFDAHYAAASTRPRHHRIRFATATAAAST